MEPTAAITGAHPVVVGLEHKVAELERSLQAHQHHSAKQIQELRDTNARQSTFQRWLIGILVGIGIVISGFAYDAHSMLAARLIEVGTATNEKLARIEERLWSMEGRIDREMPKPRAWTGSAGSQ